LCGFFSCGRNVAAKRKLNMNNRLAKSAGAFLSTCLYKNPPSVGPIMNENVELAVNLRQKKLGHC
jgi:hypothetical protein